MNWREILAYEVLGNTVRDFLIFAGILLFGFIFKTVLSRLLSRILYKIVNRFTTREDNLQAFKRLLLQPLVVPRCFVFLFSAFLALHDALASTELRDGDHFLKAFAFRTCQVFVIVALTWVIMRFVDFIGLIF